MKSAFSGLAFVGLAAAVAAWLGFSNASRHDSTSAVIPVQIQRPRAAGDTLKPVVIVQVPRTNTTRSLQSEQVTATDSNLIFYQLERNLVARDAIANRIVWQRPLPLMLAVVRSVLITLEPDGKLTGANAATLKPIWSLATRGSDAKSLALQTPILRGVGDLLLTAGFAIAQYSPGALELMYILDPLQGSLVAKSTLSIEGGYSVLEERYVAWSFRFDSPRGYSPVNVIDTLTGQVRISDQGTLNLSWSKRESVFVSYPSEPPADQYPNVDGYRVRVEIRDATAKQNLVEDLGIVQLGPRPGCYPRNLPVGLREVSFLASNDRYVWLSANDACGNRIAQLERRATGRFTMFDLPETTPLEERKRALDAGRDVISTGTLTLQQRVAILGEPPTLAALRADAARALLIWSAARGNWIYALSSEFDLTVYEALSGKLLFHARLALPQSSTPFQSNTRVEVEQRVLVLRSNSSVAFFVLPI